MSNIYRVEVATRDAAEDAAGRAVLQEFRDLGLQEAQLVRQVQVTTICGSFSFQEAERIARRLLVDAVVEMFAVNAPVLPVRPSREVAFEIVRRPGVMDPAEAAIRKGITLLGLKADWVRTSRKFLFVGSAEPDAVAAAALKVLANDVIEEVIVGHDARPIEPQTAESVFTRTELPLLGMNEEELARLSREGQLSLNLAEMQAIQGYFRKLARNPTDIELETLAQTWSEHCVHKTFKGRIVYREEGKPEERIDNLLKTTVARATRELARDWCWSVFVDNAGVIDFDGEWGAAFKCETHNHPSAIEPYGGAGTGLGGVIRDPLGTGLGARPILNTDVFCFGPPDLPAEEVPKGALHPLRVMKGVVAGVRDYGNRMGIPTANGALAFDRRFIGNPLVFCGNLALVPRELAARRTPRPGQIALVVGGRTGRDGIHGATFSSAELHEHSEKVSSGAVQIGNPIEEKKVLDFLLRARDRGLYAAITDCGAGGLSSALGEMGAECGVRVDLDKVPLKYEGLSYTEIWISEAQERMVIAADEENLPCLLALAHEEEVEITPIARFTGDKQLRLLFKGVEVGVIDMDFLHDGVPQIERQAVWAAPKRTDPDLAAKADYGADLKALLSSWNVCSKEAVIRQYDHEVQGASVIKPLVGLAHDGPGDACVVAPRFGSDRGLVVACGLCPRYSDIDPYAMAASAIDEALRNIVAVGGSLARCAILDNFCWGNCDKPDRLGGLVRAARACYDFAVAYGVPFVSGKDSLNNEFAAADGTIAIPGTLLVSALAVMDDVGRAVSMDCKAAGNSLYLVGRTRRELGGSQWYLQQGLIGHSVPQVDAALGRSVFTGLAAATSARLVRACHDCSDGGLAVAAAEMAFAGGLGLDLDLALVPAEGCAGDAAALLFSESNSRLLAEVAPASAAAFESALTAAGAPFAKIGAVTGSGRLVLRLGERTVVDEAIGILKDCWRRPLVL